MTGGSENRAAPARVSWRPDDGRPAQGRGRIGLVSRRADHVWREPLIAFIGFLFIAVAAIPVVQLLTAGASGISVALTGTGLIGLAIVAILMLVRLAVRSRSAAMYAGIFRQAVDALPTPHFVVDRNGSAIVLNQAFGEAFGDEGADGADVQALERVRQRFSSDADALARFDRIASAAAAGNAVDGEIMIDGERPQWFEVAAFPLRERPGHVLWTLEDVTARQEMLEIIRDEQRKLRDFLENAPLGFYSVDESGRFLFVNRTLAEWLGHNAGSMVNGRWRLHDFVIEPRPVPDAPFSPFAGEPLESQGEVRLGTRGGRQFQAYVSQDVVHDPESGEVRTRSIVRDLTPEREWEEALRVSEQRIRRFFEEGPVGVTLLDASGHIVEYNPAFVDLVGAAGRSLTGQLLLEVLHGEDREKVEAALSEAISGQDPQSPLEARLLSGEERSCALFVGRFDEGQDATLVVHLIETTKQKKLEVQFAQSQKMLAVGQLAGGIAHDFNNLLTAMIGFCDLLLLRHQPGDASFSDIMQIKQNANRASNLVRQLLAFSRQQTLQPRVLNLVDVLGDLSNLLRRLLGASIDLKMYHGRNLGLVRVDQVQLEQVIINLAVNARDAMGGHGSLTIRTSGATVGETRGTPLAPMPPGRYALIEVEDTGCGIAQEHQDRIFEPFFSTKKVGEGTGLGLSTVYGIVKQTNGFVFVDSEVGRGTTFSVYLPVYEGAEDGSVAAGAVANDVKDLTGAGTILLVEDEDPVRLFSARALRGKGYKVLEARTGEAALQLLAGEDEVIDIMITDIVMPEMDGPTLIQTVRDSRPGLRVICISGYAESSFRERLSGLPDVHFLPKPFSLQQLAGKVKDVLATPARPAA